MTSTDIARLPNALNDARDLPRRIAGKRLAVFLDYDGTLTPIVERPDDAVMSPSMRVVVRELARRCPVCVVSGRDRAVVQQLMGVVDLIVAGSHGFDIWSPNGGALERDQGERFSELIDRVAETVRNRTQGISGALVEPKKSSVAVHYRLVAEDDRPRIKAIVDDLLTSEQGALNVTSGKMVYELQPQIDWDKRKAVLYLLDALELDVADVVPLYVGGDITDEHAGQALRGVGIGVLVAHPAGPEIAGRSTAAEYALRDTHEVEMFLDRLARSAE